MPRKQFFITPENVLQYGSYLRNEERAAATIVKYVRDIRVFADFLGGEKITKQAAIAWKENLRTTHEATSVNSMLAAVNGFFAFLGHDIRVKPFKIQHKTFLPTEKELASEDYNKLLDTAWEQGNKRLYFAIQTIGATGIRVSELKFITVEAVKKGRADVENKGKVRTILMPDNLRTMLLSYAKKHGITFGSVFVTKNGKPLNRSNLWAEMKKLAVIAGVEPEKVFPHALRRHFAVKFHDKAKDLSKLADVLGHSNLTTTRIYLKSSGTEHRKLINSLGLVRWRLVT